ncbi:unnamed protein product [Diamesa serratosioi]
MMSETLYSLEKSVNNAGNQLDTLASKLGNVEKNLLPDPMNFPENPEDEIVIPVLELLESVSDVTTEYETLRKDLLEMQQLQKEMNTNLRYQMRVMTQTFSILKKRIEANSLQPHVANKLQQQKIASNHNSLTALHQKHK